MPGNTMGHIPYVRWWVDDWIAGTRFMSRIERDCYHELLMAQVSFKGKIPSDMIKQVMGDEYESVWPKIRHKFVEKNGFFLSKKMMAEIQRIEDYSQSRSRNRKNKKKLQKKDMKNISKTYEKHMGSGSGSGSDIDIKKEGECEGETKRKRQKSKKCTPPTYEEFEKYCAQYQYKNIARKAWEYYSVADWHDSRGNPVLNWKQKLIQNWFKKEQKDPPPKKKWVTYDPPLPEGCPSDW